MPSRNTEPIPRDPLDWRPQVPLLTRRAPTISDPIVEPLWSGTRTLLHFEARSDGPPGRLALVDSDGHDVTDRDPELLGEIGRSILALDAVVDGVLTVQATRSGEGAAIIHQATIGRGSIFMPRDAGIDVERKDAHPDQVLAFVALDLLQIDGQPLFDVPLLERKRILESLVQQGERVRVAPYTRPPVDPWVASWKGAGFKGAMLKSANGRYRPGGYAPDWTTVTRLQHKR
ncbi:hypothetical protein BH20CHL5_BH20CHL5_09340 [soil metagenome]